jgi:V/A-type H+/Na+-transporting ATPase subunit E
MADLATLLESEANHEIETILEGARSKAESITQAAQEQAKSILDGKRRALEAEFSAAQTRARSSADLEAAALRLNGAHTATQQTFSNAETELRNFTKSGEYQGVLEKLIHEVKNAIGTIGKLEVHPNDVTVATAAATAAGLNVPIHANPEIETGIRASAEGGQTSVTNTLLGRLGRARDSLLAEVSKTLGGA